MRNRIMPTRLAALLATGLAVASLDAGARPPADAKSAPKTSRTTGPATRQIGLAPAPFQLFMLVAEPGSSTPIKNLTPAGDLLYQGWCNLYGFGAGATDQVRVTQSGTMVSPPKLDTLTLTRGVDTTTTALLSRLVTQRPCDFTFVIVRNAPDRIEAWRIKCTKAYVSGQNFSGTDGGLQESDSITFTAMEWSYLETGSTGKVLDELFAGYNVATGTATGGTRDATYPGGQDSNNNKLPDGWETFYGLDLALGNAVSNAIGDLDGDGQNNLQEYLAGTVPNNPRSVLRLTAVGRTGASGNNTVTLTWSSVAGKTYLVQSAGDPGGPWNTVASVPNAGDGTTTTSVNTVTSEPRFFYRVVVSP